MTIGGHLGARASALLDGQLPEDESERAWLHVSECSQCHGLIEREAWLKRRLACLGEPSSSVGAPDSLKGSLLAAPSLPVSSEAEPARAHKPFGLIAFGGGAVGAAVISVLAVGAAPADAPTVQSNNTNQVSVFTTNVSFTGGQGRDARR